MVWSAALRMWWDVASMRIKRNSWGLGERGEGNIGSIQTGVSEERWIVARGELTASSASTS